MPKAEAKRALLWKEKLLLRAFTKNSKQNKLMSITVKQLMDDFAERAQVFIYIHHLHACMHHAYLKIGMKLIYAETLVAQSLALIVQKQFSCNFDLVQ